MDTATLDPLTFVAVLLAALMHAGWNAIVKLGLDRFSSILLLALAQGALAALLIPVFPLPARGSWPWIGAAAFLHTGYKLFLIRAYAHGDLGQVYPIARGTAPLIVAVAGFLFLGEALDLSGAASVALIGLGVVAMALRGGALPGAAGPAIPWALGTAGFTAAYTLSDAVGARLSGTASGYAMWLFAVDGLAMTAFALATRGPGAFRVLRPEWKLGTLAGALSLGSYWVAIWAFTRAPVGLVSALRETSVLWALLIGAVFLGERVGPWRWLAAALILCGVALLRL